ncbi:MarR family transcriptional regulator [Chryseobacterium indologenes]|uniref:MarR family transcriptional regulator n=1 Tax=Chryseobacterium indologenes TaxID=253 RepID=A0AAD0YSL8_CHRID|nr:MarR family transcriptional regulator [Chryseobacterium indologenes]ASE60774.1 MarR family transcriptional regulator [Chryseobacterium indologenes]ATN04863.1 MarR family transcriptional regulator [Chryseobacterium indologenes]AYY86385.1 MarR family transcriptional regulator [Chryseobacterium indologenes]AYZ36287.1 MarR family transcriptional regulator [Chryseobacterium indologenes]AZB16473.1 MarR family transcriptional regulator [Chryseobacterium indologenes]
MKTIEKEFFNTFTDFQCLILAHMNRGDINGVTATHYNIIEFLMRKENATGREISTAFKISQAAVSKQLKFLLSHDFIIQEQDTTDRRKFNLSVTEKGRFIVENSETFRKNITRQTASILTTQELENFNYLLAKVLNQIKL